MGTDNRAEFILSIEADGSGIGTIFNAFKRQLKSDVAELEAITNKIDLFASLPAKIKASATEVDRLRAGVESLKRTIASVNETGGNIEGLTVSLKQAERAARDAEKEFAQQIATYRKLRTELQAAGVDTKNLVNEQARLAAALRAAAAAALEQQQKQALGFKTLRDIAPEVQRLTSAYTALRDSGKLSFGELSQLQAKYQQSLAAVRKEVGSIGEAFVAVRGSIIAFSVLFAGIGAGIASATKQFREFSTQIAAIDTIADVSKSGLKDLENGVRTLSTSMGVDAVDSAKALYEIIGSGIPTDNAIQVLAISTQAARAGLTDVATAATAGVSVLNGFGLKADQLDHVMDVLFQTVKDGVITFKEIGENIGNVTPIAAAAKVSVEEVGAAFATLTAKSGIKAPEAATAIARAITELAAPAPEAAEKLRELGISFNGLLGTVEQFSKLNLSFDQINKLIPEVRAAKAVFSFAQNFEFLKDQVELASKKSGQMKAAYDIMAETPQAKIDRFNSAIAELSRTIGEHFTRSALPFIAALTAMANAFNDLSPKTKAATIEIIAFAAAAAAGTAVLKTIATPLNLIGAALLNIGPAATVAAQGLTLASIALNAFRAGLVFLIAFKVGEWLEENFGLVRQVGNDIAILLGAVTALGSFIGGTLKGIFTANADTVRQSTREFITAAKFVAGEFVDSLFSAGQAARESARDQQEFTDKLVKLGTAASKAAADASAAVGTILTVLRTNLAAVDTALASTERHLGALVTDLQKQVSAVQASSAAALATLAADTQAALNAVTSTDIKKITETVAIQKQAATDRFAIIQKGAADAIAAFEREAETRRVIAANQKLNLARVEQEIRQDRIAILQSSAQDTRAYISDLQAQYQQHIQNLRSLEEQRRTFNLDVDAQIRGIRRESLTAYNAYADQIKEIDKNLALGREALDKGETKIAEDYARRAIAAASGVSKEVKEGEKVVVDALTAQTNATNALERGRKLFNDANAKATAADKQGIDAVTEKLKEAEPVLQKFREDIAALRKESDEAIKVRIETDLRDVKDALEDFREDQAKRGILVPLITELTQADAAIEKKRKELEKGIPVTLTAETKALDDAILKVKEARPDLQVQTDNALEKVKALRGKVDELANEVTTNHTVKSNVPEIQRAIDKLKDDTKSTHTVTIKTVREDGTPAPPVEEEKKAAGGYVGSTLRVGGAFAPVAAAVNHFARGGAVLRARSRPMVAAVADGVEAFARGGHVFRRPSWRKVPGSGSGDTVPATLQAGSFVVRKAASRFYGDGMMNALAGGARVRRFGSGGPVTKDDVDKWAKVKFGFEPFKEQQGPPREHEELGPLLPIFGGKNPFGITLPENSAPNNPPSFQDYSTAPLNFDSRPIPEALLTAINVLAYAREMLQGVGSENPLLGSLKPAVLDGITRVENNPNDKTAVVNLLRAAETIGANPYIFAMWEKTTGAGNNRIPIWFVDWLMTNGMLEANGKVNGGKGISVEITDFAKRFFGGGVSDAFLKNFFGNNPNKLVKRRMAGGGGTTDTVRALLTPGEFVIKERAARRYGPRLLHGINDMTIPRATLAGMLAPPRRYAEGGSVEFESGPQPGNAQRGIDDPGTNRVSRDVTVNVMLDASDLLSEANVRKKVFPVIRDMLKRSD